MELNSLAILVEEVGGKVRGVIGKKQICCVGRSLRWFAFKAWSVVDK